MTCVETSEDRLQAALLSTPLGELHSGRVRYAAAMYFYQQRRITEQVLEIYRECLKDDWADAKSRLMRWEPGCELPSIE